MKKEESFNEIIKENSNRIMRICSYYSSGNSNTDDLYQEVLINIWKSLEKFRGESAISTWIYRIAVNTCLTHSAKTGKYYSLIINATPEMFNVLADDEHLESIQKEQNFEALTNELNLLSVIDKALISLVVEGLSTKEISDVIGITEPNVRTKICRIKNELRKKLN